MSDSCSEICSHSRVKVEEGGRKATFINSTNKKYRKSRVDDCLVKDGPRADYLVSELNNASVIIELKGRDVSHACDQLFASIEDDAIKAILENKVGFLVICRKYPKFDTFVAKAKARASKQYKAGFHVLCDQREVDINEVVKINGKI